MRRRDFIMLLGGGGGWLAAGSAGASPLAQDWRARDRLRP